MKQLFFSCCMIILCSFGVYAQAPDMLWGRQYNGPAGASDNGRGIVIDKDNNVYVTGSSEGKKGNADIATIKYSSTGQQIWVKRYNGTGNADDYSYSITRSDSGYVYVAGRSTAPNGKYDYVVIKYDADGNQKWVARYDGPSHLNDQAHDVKVDANGSVFVTGGTEGVGQFNGFVITTVKYSAGGNLLWVDNYGNLANPTTDAGASKEEGNSLALDEAGSIYLAGVSADMLLIKYNDRVDANGKPYAEKQWVQTVSGGSNGRKILYDGANVVATGWGGITVKYDPSGMPVWTAVSRPTPTASFWNMTLDANGNAYVTGTTSDNGTKEDFAIAKITGDGTIEWLRSFDGTFHGIDIARSVAVDWSGNVYVTGHSVANNGSRNGMIVFEIAKYSNGGVLQWATYYNPGKLGSDGFDIATDADGNVCAIGQCASKVSSNDYATVKYPAVVTPQMVLKQPIIESSNKAHFYFNSYPNPAHGLAVIEFQLPKDEKIRLSVVDLLGNEIAVLVNETKRAGTYKLQYSTNRSATGVYLFRLQHGMQTETKRFVVVE